MEWWNKVVGRARVKPGGGLLKLHDDVQTCGYEDIQIMWEMLRRSESQVIKHKNSRGSWRNFAWFDQAASPASFSTNQPQ